MKSSKKVLMNVTLLEEFRRKDEGSYLDCFMPLVCACLVEDDSEQIDNTKLHRIFSKNFVTNIPKHAMKAILRRAKQKGYLIQNGSVWSKNVELIQKTHNQFLKASKKIELAQEQMIQAFQSFAKSRYQKVVTDVEFLDAFTVYMQKHFMDYLKLDIVETKPAERDRVQNMEYMIGMFLKEQWALQKAVPEFIQINVQGFYLANYLGYFDNNLHERLKVFQVYLDTPIVMGLLGWNGKSTARYYSELVSALQKQQVSFFIFEETVDEVKGVLRGYIKSLKSQNWEAFNPNTLRYIKNNLIGPESIEREIAILENKLKSMSVKVCEAPERIHAFQMDEEGFRRNLVRAGYDEFRQNTDRDVNYVSSIHRLREAKFIDHNSAKVPVYFTDNDLLIGVSIDFFKHDDDEHSSTIPHCISDVFLSSLLLLRSPADGIGISKRKIIAEAFATIHTDNDFWQKIYNRVDVLARDNALTEEDYYIFRYSTELHTFVSEQKILQNLSLDDLDNDKIFAILQSFKNNLTKEKDKVIAEIELENSLLKEANGSLLAEKEALDLSTADLTKKLSNTLDGHIVVKWIANGAAGLAIMLILGGLSVVTYLDKFSYKYPDFQLAIKGSSFLVWLVLTVLSLNLKSMKSLILTKLEDKILKAFIRWSKRN